jgi:hypothetical protein
MKNPDYHPDTAHLPSNEDKIRWKNGGKEKWLKQENNLKNTIKRFSRFRDKAFLS